MSHRRYLAYGMIGVILLLWLGAVLGMAYIGWHFVSKFW